MSRGSNALLVCLVVVAVAFKDSGHATIVPLPATPSPQLNSSLAGNSSSISPIGQQMPASAATLLGVNGSSSAQQVPAPPTTLAVNPEPGLASGSLNQTNATTSRNVSLVADVRPVLAEAPRPSEDHGALVINASAPGSILDAIAVSDIATVLEQNTSTPTGHRHVDAGRGNGSRAEIGELGRMTPGRTDRIDRQQMGAVARTDAPRSEAPGSPEPYSSSTTTIADDSESIIRHKQIAPEIASDLAIKNSSKSSSDDNKTVPVGTTPAPTSMVNSSAPMLIADVTVSLSVSNASSIREEAIVSGTGPTTISSATMESPVDVSRSAPSSAWGYSTTTPTTVLEQDLPDLVSGVSQHEISQFIASAELAHTGVGLLEIATIAQIATTIANMRSDRADHVVSNYCNRVFIPASIDLHLRASTTPNKDGFVWVAARKMIVAVNFLESHTSIIDVLYSDGSKTGQGNVQTLASDANGGPMYAEMGTFVFGNDFLVDDDDEEVESSDDDSDDIEDGYEMPEAVQVDRNPIVLQSDTNVGNDWKTDSRLDMQSEPIVQQDRPKWNPYNQRSSKSSNPWTTAPAAKNTVSRGRGVAPPMMTGRRSEGF